MTKGGGFSSYGEFLCPISNCGKIVERNISSGKRQKSCGCIELNLKHGESFTNLYWLWNNIKQRCNNPNCKSYKDYGGRGITICDEWLEFIPFMDWALTNEYADNLVIDRKENNLGYSPDNCRFITVLESNRNKRNTITLEIANEIRGLYNTNKYTQKELSEMYNVTNQTISLIINNKQWKN